MTKNNKDLISVGRFLKKYNNRGITVRKNLSLNKQADEAIVYYDAYKEQIIINSKFQNMLGYSESELINMEISQIIDINDLDNIRLIAIHVKVSCPEEIFFRIKKKNGKFATVILIGEWEVNYYKKVLKGIIRDVTKYTEPKREKLEETYKISRKLNESNKIVKILAAEDNLVNRMIIKELIIAKGWLGKTVNNGKEAIEALKKEKYDLILMDVSMPIMNGVEAMKIIKKEPFWNGIPIIALTGYTSKKHKEKLINMGMDDYLSKPVNKEKLYSMIIKHLSSFSTSESKLKYHNEYIQGLKSLEKVLDGNSDLVISLGKKILDMFSQDEIKKIIKFIKTKNILKLREVIHKLKGAISNFKLITLQLLLKKLRDYGIKRDTESALKVVLEIEEEIEKFAENIEKYENQSK